MDEEGQRFDAALSAETYEIRVRGHLDRDYWSQWFDGMQVALHQGGETVLCGPIPDQSALHGLLAKVRDLGLTLVAVKLLTAEDTPCRGGREEPIEEATG